MFELAEEALDEVALAIERLAETGFPLAGGLCRDVGGCALVLDQRPDAVGIIGLVGEQDGARTEMVEQAICNLSVMRLASGQSEPDRESLCVDDDVDLGRKAAPAATETRIWTPLFAVAACWCARIEVLSIIWI